LDNVHNYVPLYLKLQLKSRTALALFNASPRVPTRPDCLPLVTFVRLPSYALPPQGASSDTVGSFRVLIAAIGTATYADVEQPTQGSLCFELCAST
jgi:hypothetical protein